MSMTACDNDGETLTMPRPDDVTIEGPDNEIVLDADKKETLVLTLNWNANGELTLSNPQVAIADEVVTNTIMFSTSNTFDEVRETYVPDKQYYYIYTATELNEIATGLGITPGERGELYVMVRTNFANNIEPKYSNILTLYVTPYLEKAANQVLYLSGHDDATSGSWHFNNYIRLYDDATLSYAGGVVFASKWGYKVYNTAGDWHDCYTGVSGSTAESGTLEYDGKNNIPAPENGLYILDVSIGALKYSTIAVNKVSYSGLNDDWSITDMEATETPGVYTAVVTKKANTPYGVKILINGSWKIYFGGNGNPGELCYKHEGFVGDNDLANGTYILTVDLVNTTYSYTEQ